MSLLMQMGFNLILQIELCAAVGLHWLQQVEEIAGIEVSRTLSLKAKKYTLAKAQETVS